jgi:hypothetical protein
MNATHDAPAGEDLRARAPVQHLTARIADITTLTGNARVNTPNS